MNHGWIIQNKYTDKFVKDCNSTTPELGKAHVYDTRQIARDDRYAEDGEMVRRVELYKNGKVKRIAKRKG